MEKITVPCQKCGKNNIVDKIEDENTSIQCIQCGENMLIKNLMGKIIENADETNLHDKWFYQYGNNDIRIGISLRSIKRAVSVFLFLIFIVLITTRPLIGSPEYILLMYLFSSPAILWFVFNIITSLCGKFEIFIGKENYTFFGIGKLGIKKRFKWDKVGNIQFKRSVIYFPGKEKIRLLTYIYNTRGFFLKSALNYIVEMNTNE